MNYQIIKQIQNMWKKRKKIKKIKNIKNYISRIAYKYIVIQQNNVKGKVKKIIRMTIALI